MQESLTLGARLEALRLMYQSGTTRSYKFRSRALKQLEKMVLENREALCGALRDDLRKPFHESLIGEIGVLLSDIRMARKNLRRWMRPEKVPTPVTLWPARSRIYREPLGVVLIIAPWNYPVQLSLMPLVGAIAAGNCAVVKPSELAPSTSFLLAQLVKRYFSPDHVTVVEGGVPEATELLGRRFDHIFFTGSPTVGRIVMQAAAKNLIPVTLELGGKSPVIVCEDADLNVAARRIVWSKFYNAGQTCVAPDFLCVQRKVFEPLLNKLKDEIHAQLGASPRESEDYARIINHRHLERLAALMDRGRVYFGGEMDLDSLYFGPTILVGVSWEDPVMKEEIFGPILPVLSYDTLEELFAVLEARPKPLAAYFFSQSRARQREFLENVSFGGGSINDLMVHLANPHLPFGGVGNSGMGSYRGMQSFLTFSHSKSVINRSRWFDVMARYAPMTAGKLSTLRKLLRI